MLGCRWASVVDVEFALLFSVAITAMLFELLVVDVARTWPPVVYLQALIPLSQLALIVGLSCDQRKSNLSQFLCTGLSQFLGKISYSLFLVYNLVHGFASLIIHGPISRPMCGDFSPNCAAPTCGDPVCQEEWNHYWEQRTIPGWCVPVVLPIMLLAAVMLHYGFESPSRQFLDRLYPKRAASNGQLSTENTRLLSYVGTQKAQQGPIQSGQESPRYGDSPPTMVHPIEFNMTMNPI